MSDIHARLATPKNQDILSDPKLGSRFELGRVHNSGHSMQAFDVGNIGGDM